MAGIIVLGVKIRACSKLSCNNVAAATLTYAYQDSQAVLGPLSVKAEPNSYDLCIDHAQRLSVPQGWELIRLPGEFVPAQPSHNDLEQLAQEIRDAAQGVFSNETSPKLEFPKISRRKGHLAVLADPV